MENYKELLNEINSMILKLSEYQKESVDLSIYLKKNLNENEQIYLKQLKEIEVIKFEINEYGAIFKETMMNMLSSVKNNINIQFEELNAANVKEISNTIRQFEISIGDLKKSIESISSNKDEIIDRLTNRQKYLLEYEKVIEGQKLLMNEHDTIIDNKIEKVMILEERIDSILHKISIKADKSEDIESFRNKTIDLGVFIENCRLKLYQHALYSNKKMEYDKVEKIISSFLISCLNSKSIMDVNDNFLQSKLKFDYIKE